MQSEEGPWRRFMLDWRIEPAADGCVAHGAAVLDFRSPMLAMAARFAWPEIEAQVKSAFAERMRARRGAKR